MGMHSSRIKRRKLKKAVWPAVLLLTFMVAGGVFAYHTAARKDIQFVKNMKVGWNLSNTLDVHNLHYTAQTTEEFETYWGSPVTSFELIQALKHAGFNTIRIPVTWYEHVDENYIIEEAWMARVQQVVDYCIQNELYVIINAHHDAWYQPSPSNAQQAEQHMQIIWQQIAQRFAEYDQRLLFEGMNEPRLIGSLHEWNAGTPKAREIVNRLNQVFVETIRASLAEHNQQRYLLLPTYCAAAMPEALDAFCLPNSHHLIVSIHLYRPYDFTLNEEGTSEWQPNIPQDVEEIDQAIEHAKKRFIDKNIPVIISEFGAFDKKNEEARARWTRYVMQKASAADIMCIWWDNSLLDRKTLQWRTPQILDALVDEY